MKGGQREMGLGRLRCWLQSREGWSEGERVREGGRGAGVMG